MIEWLSEMLVQRDSFLKNVTDGASVQSFSHEANLKVNLISECFLVPD